MIDRLMQKSIFSLLVVGVIYALTACSPKTEDVWARRPLVAPEQAPIPQFEKKPDVKYTHVPEKPLEFPPEEIVWITQDGGKRMLDFNPRTDIIFVVDDSDSMVAEQENLSRNINRFIDGFRQNKMIDFRIAVMSVWDSSDRFATQNKSGYKIGEFRKLKNAKGQQADQRYVSRFQGFESVLAASLKIGVTSYAQGGPEKEEIFSPLSASLKLTGRGAANEGFFRDDAHLVVVVVTDADDGSASIDAQQMVDELLAFKGGDKKKLSAYGVLVRKSDPDSVKDYGLKKTFKDNPQCFDLTQKTDKKGRVTEVPVENGTCAAGLGPDRLEEFVVKANSEMRREDVYAKNILKLNQKDFGSDLAKIGSHITYKLLEKEIVLEERPRLDKDGRVMVRVRYGTREVLEKGGGAVIPNQSKRGWLYDPATNTVKIAGDVEYKYVEGAGFFVDLVPLKY